MKKNNTLRVIFLFLIISKFAIYTKPKKELMVSLCNYPLQSSGKVLTLACASSGCCLGTAAHFAGYNFGPLTGTACGLTASVTLLPIGLKAIQSCIFNHQKKK